MDSHLYSGYEVPPYYDSLLGKLIVWGRDRTEAVARSRQALDELVIDGLVTNVPLHRALLDHDTFLDGEFTTNLLDRVGSRGVPAGGRRLTFDHPEAILDRRSPPLTLPPPIRSSARESCSRPLRSSS